MPHSRHWPARRQRAFTLVEIAVVVVIIGVLAALGLPGYRKATLKSKATAVVNDLRVFASALSNSNLQNGGWPVGGTGPGVIPPEMASALPIAFTKTTPIGGHYYWLAIASPGTPKAAVGITLVADSDVELLEMIDRMMDDGNLAAGTVQYLMPDLVYVIEP